MSTREIIEGLACLGGGKKKCKECPWNPAPGIAWQYGCIKGQNEIAEAATKVLEEYETQMTAAGTARMVIEEEEADD